MNTIALIGTTVGLAYYMGRATRRIHLPSLIGYMVIGFVLVNRLPESLIHDISARLVDIMPVLFILFFALAGAHVELAALPSLGVLGGTYIVARSAGLVGGSRLGAVFGNVEDKVRKYIGLGILSQAGVAIGLAMRSTRKFSMPRTAHVRSNTLSTSMNRKYSPSRPTERAAAAMHGLSPCSGGKRRSILASA